MASLSIGRGPKYRIERAAEIIAENRRLELVLRKPSLSLLHISAPCLSGCAGGGEYADGMSASVAGNRLET
jgi:hypothetical protein